MKTPRSKMPENNSKPLVSVVITCYNYGEYVKHSIESVLNQTYSNLEIIIINDGSTDSSDEVISKYLINKNIKYIKQENKGQAVAKNEGIKNSIGEYIAFLDADDIWVSDKLEKQINIIISRPNIGLVYSSMQIIDNDNNIVETNINNIYLKNKSGKVTNDLLYDNFVPFSSALITRKCIESAGCFNENIKMGIDWDLWLRISLDFEFDYVDERLILYRSGHPCQMSKNISQRLNSAENIFNNFIYKYGHLLDKKHIRGARLYMNYNRGSYYLSTNYLKSFTYFAKAMWCDKYNYKGYIKTVKILIVHAINKIRSGTNG